MQSTVNIPPAVGALFGTVAALLHLGISAGGAVAPCESPCTRQGGKDSHGRAMRAGSVELKSLRQSSIVGLQHMRIR